MRGCVLPGRVPNIIALCFFIIADRKKLTVLKEEWSQLPRRLEVSQLHALNFVTKCLFQPKSTMQLCSSDL